MDADQWGGLAIVGVTFAAIGFVLGLYIEPHIATVPARTVYLSGPEHLPKGEWCGTLNVWWPARNHMCYSKDRPPGF